MAYDLQNLNEMHKAMVEYLIAKPTSTRREMAGHFGVSLAWLSTIIHSDTFQAELNRKKEAIYNVAIARPIQERLTGAAHLAIDRLYDALQAGSELRDISGAVEMLTKATGNFKALQPPAGAQTAVQVNINQISSDDLARARQLVGKAKQVTGGTNGSQQLEGPNDTALPFYRNSGVGQESTPARLLAEVTTFESSVEAGSAI